MTSEKRNVMTVSHDRDYLFRRDPTTSIVHLNLTTVAIR